MYSQLKVTEEDIQSNMIWLRNIGNPESKEFKSSAKEIAELSICRNNLRKMLTIASKIVKAQQDLNISYRLGKQPKDSSLDILSKYNVTEWLEIYKQLKDKL